MSVPSLKTPELVEKILTLLSNGKIEKQIAADIGIDVRTIAKWRQEDIAFDQAFILARHTAVESQVDRLNEIAEQEVDVQRARLKCDNIKWISSKRMPHVYGDRIAVDVTEKIDLGAALTEAKGRTLPPRYPENILDAEVVETKQLAGSGLIDSKSVAAIEQPATSSGESPHNSDADKVPQELDPEWILS